MNRHICWVSPNLHTDYIGSGEGNAAHGWGLYFAKNKDVSEGYRKTLANDSFENEKYLYKGKEIKDRTKKLY